MTKTEQNRVLAWRLKLLQQASVLCRKGVLAVKKRGCVGEAAAPHLCFLARRR